MLFCVIVFPHNGQFAHIEPRLLQFFNSGLCLGMGSIDTNHSVIVGHTSPPGYRSCGFIFCGTFWAEHELDSATAAPSSQRSARLEMRLDLLPQGFLWRLLALSHDRGNRPREGVDSHTLHLRAGLRVSVDPGDHTRTHLFPERQELLTGHGFRFYCLV